MACCCCLYILLIPFLFLLMFLYLRFTNSRLPKIVLYESERYFSDPANPQKKCPFPSIQDPASLYLSVIVPAYNEEKRLPPMLEECLNYLEERKKGGKFAYEVIVVDDGSKDKTTQVALSFSSKYGVDNIRVMTLEKNRGKGGAVRLGMLCSRGKLLLLADGDGATKFADVAKLEEALEKEKSDVAIGSRAHLEKESIAKRSLFRTILMYGFHAMVWIFGVQGIRDTQCGFKLFSREAAKQIFYSLHVECWAFDVELLYIAQQLGYRISEVAVNWTEIEGSKLVPFFSWIEMAKDLVLLRLRYMSGAWRIASKQD